MKIGIDARICDERSYYGEFICELVEAFVDENTEHEIIVYRKDNCNLNRLSLLHDNKTKNLFEKEAFAFMIFFDYHVPHGYKGEFIVLIESLKEVFFPKKQWLHRKIYSYKLKRAIEKSTRVFTLDGGTALELNERLNVPEDKIRKINGFFPKYQTDSHSPIKIDIKTKHGLQGKYFVYDSGNEVHNNFERILKTIKLLKEASEAVYIIILCDSTNKDLEIRSKVIEYGITEQILFHGSVSLSDEKSYYEQSLGVLFSSIYESFPFNFSKALAYNCSIFANEIPANKDVMGDTISYLDPLSIHNMKDTIKSHLDAPNPCDYDQVFSKYSVNKTAMMLSKELDLRK